MKDQPKYISDMIQTGNFYEGLPSMPGHHETPQTPVGCLCCGKATYYGEGTCICRHVGRWFEDELKNVACEIHLTEKVKDGIFRT